MENMVATQQRKCPNATELCIGNAIRQNLCLCILPKSKSGKPDQRFSNIRCHQTHVTQKGSHFLTALSLCLEFLLTQLVHPFPDPRPLPQPPLVVHTPAVLGTLSNCLVKQPYLGLSPATCLPAQVISHDTDLTVCLRWVIRSFAYLCHKRVNSIKARFGLSTFNITEIPNLSGMEGRPLPLISAEGGSGWTDE